jgi:pyruvate kinase
MKLTKIIATIGPQSQDESTISSMVVAGMNLIRMNFSHGSYQFHEKTIEITRTVSKKLGSHIGILMDLQGPKLRTGELVKETVSLSKGDLIELTVKDVVGDWNVLSVNYAKLPQEARVEDRILIDDGNIELRVEEVTATGVKCRIINGGVIRAKRGVNFPNSRISVSSITDKDKADLAFGIERGVDCVALSFVRKAEDIMQLRSMMKDMGSVIPIIAKIEKPEAVDNIDDIIDQSDGIMVARGDLGAETSPQDVPILQKLIIGKCNRAGKPVITATQMLESMIKNPRPTRAEAADVANAIFDGTDCIMLSGETAVGDYPLQSVVVMYNIARRTEEEIFRRKQMGEYIARLHEPAEGDVSEHVASAAVELADNLNVRFIVSFTLSGRTAALVSRCRPSVPIIAMSPSEEVLRRLSPLWGVQGMLIEQVKTTEEMVDRAEELLVKSGYCNEGDTVLLVGGVPVLANSPTNIMKVHQLKLGERNI